MTRNILALSAALLLTFSSLFSQKQSDPSANLNKLSGTPVPPQQWDEWFNNEVQKFKEKNLHGKTNMAQFTIPVIFHIIHNGAAVGTAPNISAARINAQLTELNKVFGGVGTNPSAISHYSQFIANPGISFCLALTDPTNLALGEPGINRVDAAVFGVNTSTINNDQALLSFIDYTVKPAIIWDPTRYLNIILSEKGPTANVLGSARFPANTSLMGLGAVGNATNDAVWCVTSTVGNTLTPGTLAGYANGKTLCREIGHYLGLRNIWGDVTCGSDYCSDTPPATGPNYGCPSLPHDINSCGAGLSPGGEMTMNIMDYTNDACRYMFTPEQVIRMHTAMSQCANRNLLGTHGICSPTVTTPPGAAIASFSLTAPAPCFGQAFTPVNTSTGSPAPTFTWNLTPNTATVNPGYFVAMPSFNLSNQGTYTLELIASNSVATTSYSYVFTTSICPKDPVCMDTLKKIKNTDTLTVYSVNSSTSVIGCNVTNPGFLTGTNCYKDKEYAQYFAGSTYSDVPVPQLSGVYVLFNKNGTRSVSGTSNVYCNLWGGSFNGGPVTLLAQKPAAISAITTSAASTWSTVTTPTDVVTWCGTPTYTFSSKIVLPYKFDFNPPYLLPTSGFLIGVEMPWTSPGDSANVFSNTLFNAPVADTSVFVRTSSNTWFKLFKERQKNVQLAVLPIVTCKAKVGLDEYQNELDANIMLMPNPNNGVFSIITTLRKEQDLQFRIYNYLGDIIGQNKEESVTNRVFEIDMSNNASGVYFVEITNGVQKTVKKVVITK